MCTLFQLVPAGCTAAALQLGGRFGQYLESAMTAEDRLTRGADRLAHPKSSNGAVHQWPRSEH